MALTANWYKFATYVSNIFVIWLNLWPLIDAISAFLQPAKWSRVIAVTRRSWNVSPSISAIFFTLSNAAPKLWHVQCKPFELIRIVVAVRDISSRCFVSKWFARIYTLAPSIFALPELCHPDDSTMSSATDRCAVGLYQEMTRWDN